jgi:hypothetical protein
MIMEHRVTGNRIDSGAPFSLPALLLGPLWFFAKGMVAEGLAAGAVVIITVGVGWIALPFIFPILYRRHLTKQGFVVVQGTENFSRSVSSPAPDPTPHVEAAADMHREIAAIPVDLATCMECGSTADVSLMRPILECMQEKRKKTAKANSSLDLSTSRSAKEAHLVRTAWSGP